MENHAQNLWHEAGRCFTVDFFATSSIAFANARYSVSDKNYCLFLVTHIFFWWWRKSEATQRSTRYAAHWRKDKYWDLRCRNVLHFVPLPRPSGSCQRARGRFTPYPSCRTLSFVFPYLSLLFIKYTRKNNLKKIHLVKHLRPHTIAMLFYLCKFGTRRGPPGGNIDISLFFSYNSVMAVLFFS